MPPSRLPKGLTKRDLRKVSYQTFETRRFSVFWKSVTDQSLKGFARKVDRKCVSRGDQCACEPRNRCLPSALVFSNKPLTKHTTHRHTDKPPLAATKKKRKKQHTNNNEKKCQIVRSSASIVRTLFADQNKLGTSWKSGVIADEDGTVVERRGGGFITRLAWNNKRNARAVNQLPPRECEFPDSGHAIQDRPTHCCRISGSCWSVRASACTLRKARNARSSARGTREAGTANRERFFLERSRDWWVAAFRWDVPDETRFRGKIPILAKTAEQIAQPPKIVFDRRVLGRRRGDVLLGCRETSLCKKIRKVVAALRRCL